MKLLFINQHYPPDSGATGKLVRELSEGLAREGHEIVVLTGCPTYEGKNDGRTPRDESVAGVRVIRLSLLPRWKTPVGRTLHYLSFAGSVLLRGWRLPRPDRIIAFSSTPIFGGVAAVFLARIQRCPLLYCVQDVYPEIAVALGLLRSRVLESFARFLETQAWRRASRVILIGRDLLGIAHSRGVDPSRIAVIANWADADRIRPIDGSPFRRELGIDEDEFVVEYAGNFGHSQDLGAILEAARIVEERTTRPIRFLLVGGGSLEHEWLRSAHDFSRVKVVPFQPEERLPEVLAAADLSLVPLRPGLTRYCLPSKVYSILASGRPVAAAIDRDSEVARIVEESDCGFRVDPYDVTSLAEGILRLSRDPEEGHRQGRNGRAFSEKEGSLERAVREYGSLLEEAL